MRNRVRNYDSIFQIFDSATPDKVGIFLKRLGKGVFLVSFIAGLLYALLGEDGELSKVVGSVWAFGFYIGVLLFAATGIRYWGLERKKNNFVLASLGVFWKTVLFVLLPAAVISGLLILWAIITDQPAFR